MIQSMTGFGKTTLQLPNKTIVVEIKSLNSKGLDLNMRIPTSYREMEPKLRNLTAGLLERGKIDFSVFIENNSGENPNKINILVLKNYMTQLQNIVPQIDETELLKIAIKMPDVLKNSREELDKEEWSKVETIISECLQSVIQFRKDEGIAIEKEFNLRISNIRRYMNQIAEMDSERIISIKDRLQTAIEELKITTDENRFEQELIYYLEKLDITEEKVRLNNHLDYFLETIEIPGANGRKLGFISQEIGREINTMGAKSNHSQMQKLVVMMKDELEKVKEQVLNVL